MSMNALILGSVDFLRSPTNGLGLGENECDEQLDGQPPPSCGQRYFALSEGSWTNSESEYLGENYGIELTITLRASVAPTDRVNVELKRALRTLAAQVRAKIHGNDLLRIAANARLNPLAENVFVEPLRFRSASKIAVRDAGWFWADDYTGNNPPSGVSITLTFGDAVRVQTIESQT